MASLRYPVRGSTRTPSPRCRLEWRDAHMIEKEAPHAADATLHDTSYALPNYTVFGRFRFVEDDVLEEDDRGFR